MHNRAVFPQAAQSESRNSGIKFCSLFFKIGFSYQADKYEHRRISKLFNFSSDCIKVELNNFKIEIKEPSLDWFFAGFITGIIGILFFRSLETLLKIPINIIVIISVVTLLYSLLAFFLAQKNLPPVRLTKSLIIANWLWSLISVVLLYLYFSNASIPGKLFLILQLIVVAGLAYFEGQVLKTVKE